MGKKVAVLAVDPSRLISKGRLFCGDKTSNAELVKDKNAFFSLPTGHSFGWRLQKNQETINLLVTGSRFNTILVETVGGKAQSETRVHGMVISFLLLKIEPCRTMRLQGIKKGHHGKWPMHSYQGRWQQFEQVKLPKRFSKALHLYPPKETSGSRRGT